MKDDVKIKKRALRDALGCFATGVGVVTTLTEEGDQRGLTINSFSSLSLDPPLICWGLSEGSGLKDHFKVDRPFVINFLTQDQKTLAEKFATAQDDRFKGVGLRAGEGGAPIFTENAGYLECLTEAVHPVGDHVIIIGRVTGFKVGHAAPLLFHKGKFKSLS